jgi:endonuclease/exonuclease/phosphatase family metal-dependent hydrolase
VKKCLARYLACGSPQQKFQPKTELGLKTAEIDEVQRFDFQNSWFVTFGLACQLIVGGNVLAAELRVVTYNTTSNVRPGLSLVLEAIGEEKVNGVARPIDVLALQEQSSSASDTAEIVDLLNDIYGAGVYDRAEMDGDSSGGGRPGLVFNTQTVELLAELAIGTVSTSAQARQILRYKIRPQGYHHGEADFYLYNTHAKSGTGSSNQARRLVESRALRNDLDQLGTDVAAIAAGDFNIRSSSEPSYQELLRPGTGQLFDPLGMSASWHCNNASSCTPETRRVHTQSTIATGTNGLIGGGIDDRFDFQLVTDTLLDDEGIFFIDGSYHTFGNNGTHDCCNHDISTGAGGVPSILTALETASDHLPVIADYRLPSLVENLEGDFNQDGFVSAGDYTAWQDGLGMYFEPADYNVWRENFNASSPTALTVVPEPTGWLIWLTCGFTLIAWRWTTFQSNSPLTRS